MFAKTIIDSDAFLDMPLSAQCLYFHLSMRADDDGFINNPKKIQRMIGASDDDLKLLIAKRFIITFESGVVVIKHWRIHNYIQSDRYKPTVYAEEKALLKVKPNGGYSLDTECIQDGYSLDTQVRLGKDSIGKVNNNGAFADANANPKWVKPTVEQIAKYAMEKGYEIDAEAFYDHYEANGWMVGKTHMKKWKAAVANWARSDYNKSKKGGWAF